MSERVYEQRRMADYRAGTIAAAIVNSNPWRRNRRPAEWDDFMPTSRDMPKGMPHEVIVMKARHAFAMAGFPLKKKAPATG